MKKIIWSIIIIIVLVIVVIAVKISDNKIKIASVSNFNEQFEEYKDKTLYGADVLTIINKAIDNNKNYNIPKDDKDFYIDDGKYCIKVELTLLNEDESGKINEVRYQMEVLQKAGLDGFISSFSLTAFECTNIEYNNVRKNFKSLFKTA